MSDSEPNETPTTAIPVNGQSCLAGDLQANDQDFFRWNVSNEQASRTTWQFELQGGHDNLTKLVLFRADRQGENLPPVRLYSLDADGGRTTRTGPLLLGPGDYLFGVTKGGSDGSYTVKIWPSRQLPEVGDTEPNDRADQGTPVTGEFALTGDLSGSVDYFRWTIPETSTEGLWQLRLQSAVGQSVRLRIYDGKQSVLLERATNAEGVIELPDLQFAVGVYDIELSPPTNASAPYVLEASAQRSEGAGREVEPNDTLQTAFPLDAKLAARGRLSGPDKDVYSFQISDAPMLWRVTVLGKDKPVTVLRHYSGGGTLDQQVRAGSDRTTRLDNLLLLPGKHFVEIEGEDTPYLLKVTPIGPADLTQKAEASRAPVGSGEAEAAGPRPAGSLELEPNDSDDRANPLRVGAPRVGTLPQADDKDVYSFRVGADQPVRITVTPPAAGQVVVRLAAGSGGGPSATSPKPGDPAAYEGVLRTGDYTATVQAQGAVEGYYQILLEQTDPLASAYDKPLPVSLSLGSDAPAVAAYRAEGQRLGLQVGLENTGSQPESVTLEAVSSDRGWVPGRLGEAVTLAPGERRSVPLPVEVAPDARDDQPARITVAATNGAGQRSTASVALVAACDAPLVEPVRRWAIPDTLRGGFNAAWTGLGATVHSDNPFAAELFDGLAVPVLDASRLKVGETVTIELSGTEPVTLVGTLLNPLGRNLRRMEDQLQEFTVLTSLDGKSFEPVLSARLDTALEEQAFAFDRPVEARYAQLRLVSNVGTLTGAATPAVTLGEWKLVASPGEAPVQTPLNLADPGVGGYLAWADPVPVDRYAPLSTEAEAPTVVTGERQSTASWVVGFLHDRAAQLTGLEWVYPAAGAKAASFAKVDVAVSLDSPVGPWQPLGSLALEAGKAGAASLALDKPVWARFVRFVATGLAPKTAYLYPETLRILERRPDGEYRSILAEWGHYSRDAVYEALAAGTEEAAVADSGANGTRAEAQSLATGQWLAGSVLLGQDEDWYRIEVPAEQNTLRLHLRGDPVVSYAFELTDSAGQPMPTRAEATVDELLVTASVTPGSYFLRLHEPPRSVVLSWDTSASLSGYSRFILASAARFALGVQPGQEVVNLLPYGNPSSLLLPQWADQPLEVMAAVNNFDPSRLFSSNSEEALLTAAKALNGREGARAVIVMTDAYSDGYRLTPELWRSLEGSRPRVYTLHAPSTEHTSVQAARSQSLMESWADVGGGRYDSARSVGNFDLGIARATCQLRRPKQYRVLAETTYSEPVGTGSVRVIGGGKKGAGKGAALTVGDKTIEIILDASGSMQKRIGGRPRYQIAKDVLTSLIKDTLPEGTPFALRVFGNRQAKSCRTDLEVPLGPLNAQSVRGVIAKIAPKQLGGTPIADSLKQVPADLRGASGGKVVVLITDGEESCEGDVDAAIEGLRGQNIDVQLSIIGFDFDATDKEAARRQFQHWAKLGGGQYFDAKNASELASALSATVKPGFEVVDAGGTVVATGSVDGAGVTVDAGTYTVRVLSSPPETFGDVKVVKDQPTELTLK